MRLEPPWLEHYRVRSLSSAVRIFVLEHLEAVAGCDAIERALAITVNRQRATQAILFSLPAHFASLIEQCSAGGSLARYGRQGSKRRWG
jgi:hypothetical protein